MPNRLAREKSPYLLQHADNPVDWYAWGDEAFRRAEAEDRPLLVSIGYSACHWCHVMAHESFEDPVTANLMNERFVNVKVDREERPDVDAIYMEAVQMLTGQGGWPLNVFLTPDGSPFYGGTYFPPEPRHGMPSWGQVLEAVAQAYADRREDVVQSAKQLTQHIRQAQQPRASAEMLGPDLLHACYRSIKLYFDWENGGFGAAPKFPQPLSLDFLLRMAYRFQDDEGRRFAELTLNRMAEGGIYDQLGGGFHRYAVDSAWVVPHFEKMLYDNALLARLYVQAYQVTADPRYRRIVEETLEYVLREMRSPDGGLFSAQDADSEGVEGKYYVWTPEEVESVLGKEAARLTSLHYGITKQGNFEGKTILTVAASAEEIAGHRDLSVAEVERILNEGRERLLRARSQRVPPGKDTKILVSWNALAVRALAEAGRVLGRPDFLRAAEDVADFLLDELFPGGQLMRSYNQGPSEIRAFLEDYAYLIEALISLFETVFRVDYLERAGRLVDEMVCRFWDESEGAFFDTAANDAGLVIRPRGIFDNPIPSGPAAASFALLRLEAHTGETKHSRKALAALRAARDLLPRAPLGFGYLLCSLDFYLASPVQVAIVGRPGDEDTDRLVQTVYEPYLPNKVVAVGEDDSVPLLAGRQRLEGRPTAYVCEHFSCRIPVTEAEALEAQLRAAPTGQQSLQ